jgi:uncharacterized protein YndB with AHSA1/START domain
MAVRYQKVMLQRQVMADPRQVYRAFTNATVLREWFCDVATVNPNHGGRIYMAWDDGYYSSGYYLVLKEFKEVAFTWFGRGEPRETRVSVRIKAQKGGSLLTLEHLRIGAGKAWASIAGEFQKEWEKSLDNLASVLETGEDLRLTQRPMMGIGISDFDAEIARQIGVPISKGMRLDAVVQGMGAEAAGLLADDVIVRLGGHDTPDGASLHTALQVHRAGDRVEVEYYRGAEKKTTSMQLSRRPLPELPATLQGVAEARRQKADAGFSELDAFLAGITEREAFFKPDKDAWSVMEVLAHLIHGERDYQQFICDVAGYQQPLYDDYAGNLQARNAATLAAYPKLAEMVGELKHSTHETIALMAALPDDFMAHKAAFWQIAYNTLEPDYHIATHLEQMRAAIQAARG